MKYLKAYRVTIQRGRKWGYGKLEFNITATSPTSAKIKAFMQVAYPDNMDRYDAKLRRK